MFHDLLLLIAEGHIPELDGGVLHSLALTRRELFLLHLTEQRFDFFNAGSGLIGIHAHIHHLVQRQIEHAVEQSVIQEFGEMYARFRTAAIAEE